MWSCDITQQSIRKIPTGFFQSVMPEESSLPLVIWGISFPKHYQESLGELHGPMFQKILCANFGNKAKFKQKSTPNAHPHIFLLFFLLKGGAPEQHQSTLHFFLWKQITRFQNILAKNKLSCVSFRDGIAFGCSPSHTFQTLGFVFDFHESRFINTRGKMQQLEQMVKVLSRLSVSAWGILVSRAAGLQAFS